MDKTAPTDDLMDALKRAINYEGIDASANAADWRLAEGILYSPPFQRWLHAQRDGAAPDEYKRGLRAEEEGPQPGVYDMGPCPGPTMADLRALTDPPVEEEPREPVQVECHVVVPLSSPHAAAHVLSAVPINARVRVEEGTQPGILGGLFANAQQVVARWVEER